MRKQFFYGLGLVLLFAECNTPVGKKANPDSLISRSTDSDELRNRFASGTLTITPALLKKYQEACLRDTTARDKQFLTVFLDLLHRFNGRRLDTTIVTIGNIEGDSVKDSIFSRVYLEEGDIYVESKWVKNGEVKWQDKYADPYTEIDADIMDNNRNTWVFFAIGVVYGPPDFHVRSDVDSGVNSIIYAEGLDDLSKMGIRLDTTAYKAYLRDFKGDLLCFGQPESREGLWIWYKPAGKMITYYHP